MALPPLADNNISLTSLIQAAYDDLSRSQKALARLVLADPSLVCTCTTLELAARAGVSNATVVRFAAALGFSGYAELQKVFRRELITDRYIKEPAPSGDDALALSAILDRQSRQLAHAFSRISQNDFDRFVAVIAAARNIYVAGVRVMYAPAYFLARMLNLFLLNTTFLPVLGESAYEELFKGGEEDLFICVSVARYGRYSFTLTELAAERGIPVAVLTDDALSPPARLANISLEVGTGNSTLATCVLGMSAVVEAVLSALSASPHLGKRIRKNLSEYENGLSARILVE